MTSVTHLCFVFCSQLEIHYYVFILLTNSKIKTQYLFLPCRESQVGYQLRDNGHIRFMLFSFSCLQTSQPFRELPTLSQIYSKPNLILSGRLLL